MFEAKHSSSAGSVSIKMTLDRCLGTVPMARRCEHQVAQMEGYKKTSVKTGYWGPAFVKGHGMLARGPLGRWRNDSYMICPSEAAGYSRTRMRSCSRVSGDMPAIALPCGPISTVFAS